MAYELTKEFSFHAAHSLTVLPKEHKCSHMHGHTYRVLFTVRGGLDPDLGWVVDFGVMAQEAARLHDILDHKLLNEIEGLEVPTSENLARFVFDKMKTALTGLVRVAVYETPTSLCTYSPYEDGVTVRIGPRRFSAVHMVLSEGFEEPLHGHDFQVILEFNCAYGQGLEAKSVAGAVLSEVLKQYHNKTLLPEFPDQSDISISDSEVEFSWKGRKLILKTEDVHILSNERHSTAEVIAKDIAAYIGFVLREDEGIELYGLKVFLQESHESWVTVV